MNKEQMRRTLEDVRFLQDISNKHLEQISGIAGIRDLAPQEIVFREGEVAAHAYFVVHGNVALDFCAASTGCKRITTVGPGELLGWSALLDQSRFTATARTLEATRLVQINAAQLLAICHHSPAFGYELMRRTALALAKRLSGTRMQLVDVYSTQLPFVSEELKT